MRTREILSAGLLLLVLLLGSCGTPAAPKTQTIVIGFTASDTGKYSAESKEQVQGLQLWAAEVNAQGGFQVGSTMVQVELESYDDQSDAEQVTALYTKLATEDKVDFLISPYSSGLTAAAVVVAEQNGKLIIAVGAASDSIFGKGYQHAFQIYTPASRYLYGAVDMLKAHDPEATRIAILHENASFATEVATAAQEYSQRQGLEVVMFEQYEAGTTEFGSWIDMLTTVGPDALLGGGHFADGTALAQTLSEQGVPVKLISLLVAPAVPDFAEIGSAALYVTGPSQWEPQVQYGREGATTLGISFYGPAASEFTEAYTAEYGYAPGYHAAGGYAAGLTLQYAIATAGSTELNQVERALEEMDALTVFGRIKFDSGTRHGLQIGHEMVYLQWQQDNGGQFVKEVIWPQSAASAPLLYPRLVP